MMTRYAKVSFWAVLVGLLTLPCHLPAASITETHATIGEKCSAIGENSTAIGYNTRASGFASTSMGVDTWAGGSYSAAMGYGSTTWAVNSFVGGANMKLNSAASNTFVWGIADSEQEISRNNAFLMFPLGRAGNVGIGTPSPTKKLDIHGELNDLVLTRLNQSGNKNWCGLRLDRYASEKWFIGMGDGNTSDKLLFRRSGSSNDVVIDENGNVGIGTASPGYSLEVNGNAAKAAGGAYWVASSDRRLKDIKGEYTHGLDQIIKLKPVIFYYKSDNPRGLLTNEENIGFVAQEVEKAFPEAVSEGPDGYLNLNMQPVNVAMVNAIKELKAKNDALEAENASLEEEIEKIKEILGI